MQNKISQFAYIHIYIYISGHKWSRTHLVLKSHRSKMSIIYICNHENNVSSRLSPQWVCGNSCIWAQNVRRFDIYIYIYIIYREIYANTYNNAVRYYKLPYIGHFSTDVKRKINRSCKFYCKNLNIKIVLTPFKVAGLFVQAVMPITSVRQLAIYQQGLRSIWKRIKSPTFLRILLIMKLVRHFITENCFEIIDSTSTWVGSFLIYNEWLLNTSDFKAKPTQTFFPLKPT